MDVPVRPFLVPRWALCSLTRFSQGEIIKPHEMLMHSECSWPMLASCRGFCPSLVLSEAGWVGLQNLCGGSQPQTKPSKGLGKQQHGKQDEGFPSAEQPFPLPLPSPGLAGRGGEMTQDWEGRDCISPPSPAWDGGSIQPSGNPQCHEPPGLPPSLSRPTARGKVCPSPQFCQGLLGENSVFAAALDLPARSCPANGDTATLGCAVPCKLGLLP